MAGRHFNIPVLRRRRATGTGGLRARTSTGVANWQGYAPNAAGATWYVQTGVAGAGTPLGGLLLTLTVTGGERWQGYAPDLKQAILTGVGAATWTGPAPTVVGLIPDGAIVTRDGSTVVDRSGDYVINVAQS